MGVGAALLVSYLAFGALLVGVGHAAARRLKGPRVTSVGRTLLGVLAALLALTGLGFTNVVAFKLWAAGGPDTAHKREHVSSAYWALGVASVSFVAAGAVWPQRKVERRA